MSGAGTGAPNKVSRLEALRDANFRRFFVGQTTSQVGSSMSPLAITFAVLAHGTTADLGYVVAGATAPLVIFLLVGGVIADRLGRRLVMLSADGLRAFGQAALAAWVLFGQPPLWGFLALGAVGGVGTGLFSPALTGLVPELVKDEYLTQANALRGLSSSTASIAGPALAGVIVAVASPGWAIAVDAASYFVSVYCLGTLELVPRATRASSSFVHELRTGWREFVARTWLWVIVLQFSLCNVAIAASFYILGPAIAKQSLGGARVWGIILAAEGAGSVVGGLVMLRYRPSRPLTVATVVVYGWLLPLVGLAFRWPALVIAAGAALGGVSFAVFGALWDTAMQRHIPNDVLSRVSAYDWLGSLVFLPIGDAVIGPVVMALGYRTTLLSAAIFLAVAITVVLCVPSVRHLRGESPLPAEPATGPFR